ncbi:alcohol dehydrogenase catalytic domain-containing protein [Actinocorallia populi]|uniref:alcohol dehydrogenase catalytic domain-containing protein n=1 Tax=Actinocorallia populi TaxID=2079200 RepID=UPI000D08B57C|nr:zinc-binding dehydrogenase [Actinocorallia populi]
MKAIVQREFGPADVLVLEETERPSPGPGQVLVKVAAAGVHAVDTGIRQGYGPPTLPKPQLPMTPGREVAGTVEAVGPDVEGSWAGRRVVAHVGALSGGYAEYALAPAASLHALPDRVSFPAAIAAVGTGRTAQMVLNAARITAEDVVIVTGASGGLGNQLMQLAHSLGARVAALYGGEAKREAVTAFRRDGLVPVDTSDAAWADLMKAALEGAAPTVVLDGVGGDVARTALESLAPGGRHVIVGWASGAPVRVATDDIVERSITVGSVLGGRPADLRTLETRALEAVARGDAAPLVDEYPLADAAAAHTAIETRRSRGKVVLLPAHARPGTAHR